MKYRKLGRTGADISEIIFACGETPGLMSGDDRKTMLRVVKGALDAGITWFDTAARAADGKAEANLGAILKELGAKPRIATKIHIDPANTKDIPGQVERALTASLKRLQVDKVDLYQLGNWIEGEASVHALKTADVLGPFGAIASIEKMRDQGLATWIGITALGDTGLCRRLIESGRIDTAQVFFNMINPTAAHAVPRRTLDATVRKASRGQDFTGVIETCREKDVGVIAIRTLAAGAIVGYMTDYASRIVTKDTDVDDVTRKAVEVRKVLADRAGNYAQAAVRFALSFPGISAIDYTANTIEHLDEGVGAVDMGPLESGLIDELDRLYQSDFGAKQLS
jgi:L-galactose dehydrogenase/L-glyceraldehyde 3-phosphate reductase